MPTVKAMTLTVDSLLPMLKLDCDVGNDATMKGASVVVLVDQWSPDGVHQAVERA